MSLLDINFDSFSSAKFYQQWILRPHVVMKKTYNFPEKSELPKLILLMKLIDLFFSAVSGVEIKKNAEIRAGSLSRLAASPLDFALAPTQRAHLLQLEPARRLIIERFSIECHETKTKLITN